MSQSFPFDPPPPPRLGGPQSTWILIVAILCLIAGLALLAVYVRAN